MTTRPDITINGVALKVRHERYGRATVYAAPDGSSITIPTRWQPATKKKALNEFITSLKNHSL